MNSQGRGQLTPRITRAWKHFTGRGIVVKELRLMVHVQYVLTNSQILHASQLNDVDKEILNQWVDAGYILEGWDVDKARGNGQKLKVTRRFWDLINKMIWLGYVDLYEEGERPEKTLQDYNDEMYDKWEAQNG